LAALPYGDYSSEWFGGFVRDLLEVAQTGRSEWPDFLDNASQEDFLIVSGREALTNLFCRVGKLPA